MDADPGALLSLADVTIEFGGVRAVRGLSFQVETGRIVALIGPNGAGKTTLLNCISGFVRAHGSIRFGDVELLQLPAHRRAALGIGRTFQNLQLFTTMTLLENIVSAQHSTIRGNVFLDMLRFPILSTEMGAVGRARHILDLLDIGSYANHKPVELPFGVQKLAGVARAIASGQRLLLLDEPAAGLNRYEVDRLAHTIVSLRGDLGLAILLVEHNMRMVTSISDHVVVIDRGEKLAEGTPHEVVRQPAVIAAYLGANADSGVVEEVGDGFSGGA